MGEIPASPSIGSEDQDRIESIAVSIFSRHGVDFAAVQRAGGWRRLRLLADDQGGYLAKSVP